MNVKSSQETGLDWIGLESHLRIRSVVLCCVVSCRVVSCPYGEMVTSCHCAYWPKGLHAVAGEVGASFTTATHAAVFVFTKTKFKAADPGAMVKVVYTEVAGVQRVVTGDFFTAFQYAVLPAAQPAA